LENVKHNELVFIGDLNWDWLSPVSDPFKCFCDDAHLTQMIESATRPNPKHPEKSSLIDLFLTNCPLKYKATAVFANDISDHCVIAAVRDMKLPKVKSRIITKMNFKSFCEQAFLHDLYLCDWVKVGLMPDPDMALSYFKSLFLDITNKHAPLRKYKVKGRVNPWFTDHLSDKIHERNLAWATARKSKCQSDWIHFRHLRNKCMSLIRKAKSDYYIKEMSDMKNTSKFWKVFKSMSSSTSESVLPKEIRMENEIITDKTKMLYILNQHFIASDKLFEKEMPLKTAQNSSYSEQKLPFDFNVTPITINEVRDALKKINIKKSPGHDGLDPHLLQIAAEIIAEPLTHIFNLTIENGQITKRFGRQPMLFHC
jgi:hypothetical protein